MPCSPFPRAPAIAASVLAWTRGLPIALPLAQRDGTASGVRYGSWPCENSSALRARRSISEKLHKVELNHPAQIQLDTVSENCFFYISPMYEFSHSQGQKLKGSY